MEALWIQVKVDKRNGEIVMYDSSLENEFLKTEEDYEKFYEICMDFRSKLQQLKDKQMWYREIIIKLNFMYAKED